MTPSNRKGRNKRNVPNARRVSPNVWQPIPLNGYGDLVEMCGDESSPVLAGLRGFGGGGLGSWLSDALKGKGDNPISQVIKIATGGGGSSNGPTATVLPLATQQPAQSPNPSSQPSQIPSWIIPAALGLAGVLAFAAVVRK